MRDSEEAGRGKAPISTRGWMPQRCPGGESPLERTASSYVALLADAAASSSRRFLSRITMACWLPDAAMVMNPHPKPFSGFCQRMSPVDGSRQKSSPFAVAYRSSSWRTTIDEIVTLQF